MDAIFSFMKYKKMHSDFLYNVLRFFGILSIFLFIFSSCNNLTNQEEHSDATYKTENKDVEHINQSKLLDSSLSIKTEKADPNLAANSNNSLRERITNPAIPQKAILVLDYIDKNHRAPNGYEGGRYFGNFERNLPQYDAAGNKIKYQEWDIHEKTKGRSRGAQRIVTGSDGSAWYTPDHYNTFIKMKQ